MWLWFAKLGSPRWFYEISTRWLPWLVAAMSFFMAVGVIWALLFLPPDYQQSFTTRILVIHVAVAGTSLAFFPLMAVAGTITLVWKMKLADMVAKHAAPLGAWFSFITLATGSLWGSVMWGTWWEWDARVTSTLILFIMYLGLISLHNSFNNFDKADKLFAYLSIIGFVQIPIIKKSVDWWSSLHQPASITLTEKPAIDVIMLYPLFMAIIGFSGLIACLVILSSKVQIYKREKTKNWIKNYV